MQVSINGAKDDHSRLETGCRHDSRGGAFEKSGNLVPVRDGNDRVDYAAFKQMGNHAAHAVSSADVFCDGGGFLGRVPARSAAHRRVWTHHGGAVLVVQRVAFVVDAGGEWRHLLAFYDISGL